MSDESPFAEKARIATEQTLRKLREEEERGREAAREFERKKDAGIERGVYEADPAWKPASHVGTYKAVPILKDAIKEMDERLKRDSFPTAETHSASLRDLARRARSAREDLVMPDIDTDESEQKEEDVSWFCEELKNI